MKINQMFVILRADKSVLLSVLTGYRCHILSQHLCGLSRIAKLFNMLGVIWLGLSLFEQMFMDLCVNVKIICATFSLIIIYPTLELNV